MNNLSRKQTEEISQLKKRSDKDIDLSEIAESSDWNLAERGKFYRPIKKQITLRLDTDVVDWFKSGGDKYQTRINLALREYIDLHQS